MFLIHKLFMISRNYEYSQTTNQQFEQDKKTMVPECVFCQS